MRADGEGAGVGETLCLALFLKSRQLPCLSESGGVVDVLRGFGSLRLYCRGLDVEGEGGLGSLPLGELLSPDTHPGAGVVACPGGRGIGIQCDLPVRGGHLFSFWAGGGRGQRCSSLQHACLGRADALERRSTDLVGALGTPSVYVRAHVKSTLDSKSVKSEYHCACVYCYVHSASVCVCVQTMLYHIDSKTCVVSEFVLGAVGITVYRSPITVCTVSIFTCHKPQTSLKQ